MYFTRGLFFWGVEFLKFSDFFVFFNFFLTRNYLTNPISVVYCEAYNPNFVFANFFFPFSANKSFYLLAKLLTV